ncbi:ATP-binding protein [Marinilabilia salmonicolor]|uniref:ATP-binding protein n=1 Tax=Marinilabilia salmonicolor TaxID=989 RepID=UPI00029B28CA|nr:ATP-binding protein [Marinilabilia salmonicolor]
MLITPYIEKEYPKTELFTGVNIIEEELKEKRFFVVMENNNSFQGLLTVSDVFERQKKLVADCLTPKPSISPNATIHQALELMHKTQAPALPVIDSNQHFHGILSLTKLKELFKNYELNRTKNFEKKISLSQKIKEQFFRNLSHEIRTPLNAIQGLTEVLLYSDIPDEEKSNFAGMLHTKTDELLLLIDSLLNLSRLQAGDFRFSPDDVVQPSEVCDNLKLKADALKEAYSKSQISIKIAFNLPENFSLKTNLAYLQEVMIHLLSNAIKFTNQGVVEFGCFANENQDAVFFVKDTGAGIPLENQASIFNAFEKIETDHTRINPGMGLGLTLASKIIEGSGGKIWLDTEPGKGSAFYFYLGPKQKPLETKSELTNFN